MCAHIRIFIKVYPLFFRQIISSKNTIKYRFIMIILCISKFVKGWGGIKNSILFHTQLLQFLFLFYFLNQLLHFYFLDKLGKSLTDEDFTYLVEEFGSKNLKLLKQKGAYLYEYMNSFKRFNEEKLPARKYFTALQETGKLEMMVKNQKVT